MSRNMDSGAVGACTLTRVQLAVFAYFSFGDGDVYVWSGYGNISWGGHTWVGLGTAGGECFGSIAPIAEDSTTVARGVTVTLSGVDSSMLTHIGAIQLGRPARIWLNFMNDSRAVIGSAQTFGGLIDQPSVEEGGQSCRITLALETRLSDLQRAQTRRWTDQDQRARHPYDTGFKFIAQLQMWASTWGQS